MTVSSTDRRGFLKKAIVAGTGFAIAGTAMVDSIAAEKKKEVEANEDLMREHGVLRRALLVYGAAAQRLRTNPSTVPADALLKTARLFRTFGEDYHERQLEEKFIFPVVRKLKGPAAAYPDVLQAQHDQGRKLTEYVIKVTGSGTISGSNAAPLAKALDAFNLMYANHAAREDTIVFTAWKDALPSKRYREMSEQFEKIEKRMFSGDGFEDAVRQIGEIETQLGLANISQFTIGDPPSSS